jgi:DNA helicase-2/ATP-dependent DNA helicase PcrA
LIADIDRIDEEQSEQKDSVLLMTIHSAKGLEFPVVFMIGMEEGVFPHSRALMEEAEMEEERRLAYVGITRAEEELYVTNAKMRTLFGRTNMNPESRFIEEMPKEVLEDLNEKKSPKPKLNRTIGAKSTGGDVKAWSVGDKAVHGKWGVGVVVRVKGDGEDQELDVAFPSPVGIKRLLAKFAPIEKVQ